MNASQITGLLLLGSIGHFGCSNDNAHTAVGTLERDRLELVATASEPIAARPVEEGSFVSAGELLVKLDPTRLQAQLAQAQSAQARASARLAELVRGPRRERIDEARARLRGAEGNLVGARRLLRRAESLAPREAVSIELVDERRARFQDALAARNAARASLAEMLEGTTPEELAQAEAALAEADALLADAQVRLERTEVRAPTAGWVDALPYELGEQPPLGGVVAVLLAERSPYARVYIPAAVRLAVVPGTRARISIDGMDEPIDGRVRTVATEASFTPYFALTERDRGRLVYLAKIDLLEALDAPLPSGLPVEVELDVDTSPPQAAR